MGKATKVLEEEHRIIEKVIATIAMMIETMKGGSTGDQEALRDIVDFMKVFADKCHHGKEEGHLFPMLERMGVPASGCPLGILILEHQKGRALVKQLAEGVEAHANGIPTAAASVLAALQGIYDLYPGHIWKEDYLLFPMTDKVLTVEQQDELLAGFERVEQEMGAGVHERFEHLVKMHQ